MCLGTDRDYIMESVILQWNYPIIYEEEESDKDDLDLCKVDLLSLGNSESLDEKPLVIDDVGDEVDLEPVVLVNVSSEIKQVAKGVIGLGDEVVLVAVVLDVLVNWLE